MKSTAIAVTIGVLLSGEAAAGELALSVGASRLAGGNISESQTGFAGALTASQTLVEGIDYMLDLQHAQVGVKTDSTYVYTSAGMGVRWYPSSHTLTPYCMGHIGLFSWRIEHDGSTHNNSTGEDMKALNLGLGAGVGCIWRPAQKIGVDFLLLSHFIFSQNPGKFGSDDENEVLFQARVGLSYRLF